MCTYTNVEIYKIYENINTQLYKLHKNTNVELHKKYKHHHEIQNAEDICLLLAPSLLLINFILVIVLLSFNLYNLFLLPDITVFYGIFMKLYN